MLRSPDLVSDEAASIVRLTVRRPLNKTQGSENGDSQVQAAGRSSPAGAS